MSRRLYVPLVVDELTVLRDRGVPAGTAAFAVTSEMRSEQPGADEEDLEFEAMCESLDAATERRQQPGQRRVVVAADGAATDDGSGARVRLDAALALDEVVSLHVEETAAEVGAGYDDLLWYDVTELDDLVAGNA